MKCKKQKISFLTINSSIIYDLIGSGSVKYCFDKVLEVTGYMMYVLFIIGVAG